MTTRRWRAAVRRARRVGTADQASLILDFGELFRSCHPVWVPGLRGILVAEASKKLRDRMRSSQLGRGFAHPAMRALMGRIGAPRHMSSAAATLAAKDRFAARHLGPRESDHAAMLEAVGVDSIDDIVRKTVPSQILLDRALDLGKYSPVRLSSAHSAQTPPPPPPSPPPMPPPSPPPPSPSPTPILRRPRRRRHRCHPLHHHHHYQQPFFSCVLCVAVLIATSTIIKPLLAAPGRASPSRTLWWR